MQDISSYIISYNLKFEANLPLLCAVLDIRLHHVSVPTQVIVAKSLTAKGVMSIATKVAIQMCCKIGGAPWTVEIPLSVSEHYYSVCIEKVVKCEM
jgi:hypothetical protein